MSKYLSVALNNAMDQITEDVKNQVLTPEQGEYEMGVVKAIIGGEITNSKINKVCATAKTVAQTTAVKSLDALGKGLGFLGAVVNKAKSAVAD